MLLSHEINRNKRLKTKTKIWVLPGTSVSDDEFKAGIKEAENGPFHTVQDSMENFEVWLKSIEKREEISN